MPRKRPASVLVVAIMSIVLGSLGSLCGMCVLAGTLMGQMANKQAGMQGEFELSVQQLNTHLQQKIPAYNTVEIVISLAILMLSVILLILK